MAEAQNKTKATTASPQAFVEGVDHPRRRADAQVLLDVFNEVTGLPPKMWGSSIIGYGRYHYKYDSGREGDFFLTGFSPRKQNLSLYIGRGFKTLVDPASELGKHKTGKSCVYVNKLDDIDLDVLRKVIAADVAAMRAEHETWDE